jgi:hypothetical protein
MADMLAGGADLRKFIWRSSKAFLLVSGQMQMAYWMLETTFGRRFAAVFELFGLHKFRLLAYNNGLHWTKTRPL